MHELETASGTSNPAAGMYGLQTRLIEMVAVIRSRMLGGDVSGALASAIDCLSCLEHYWDHELRMLAIHGSPTAEIAAHELDHQRFVSSICALVKAMDCGEKINDSRISAILDHAISHTVQHDLPLIALIVRNRTQDAA